MVGHLIRKAREQAGLTQEQLAFAAHLSREYVNRVELDRSSPTLDVLMQLCRALNIAASDLMRALEESGTGNRPQGKIGGAAVKDLSPVRRGRRSRAPLGPAEQRLVGDVLERWRKEARLTRREVAAKLHLRREDVAAAEGGDRAVSVQEFLRWCDIFGRGLGDATRQVKIALDRT